MSEAANRDLGVIWPDLPTFRELAVNRRVIPVTRRVLADAETPVGLYRKLANDEVGTFLLESAEHDGKWSRYSIIGARAAAILTAHDGETRWLGTPPVGVPTSGPVTATIKQTLAALHTPRLPNLPPLTGGLVGVLSYDLVRQWQDLPTENIDELGLPDTCLGLATDLVVLDHVDSTALLIANAINHNDTDQGVDEAWHDAVARLDRMVSDLGRSAGASVAVHDAQTDVPVKRRSTPEQFQRAVTEAQRAMATSATSQVVLSQRFDVETSADPVDIYRCLRASNPSPYMYLIRCSDANGRRFDVVGSSPEALVKVQDGQVVSHPIGGTRPRGKTPQEDLELAEELRNDQKEIDEHDMLVDLARHDLTPVCEPDSLAVLDYLHIERYSHVMHLVSTVTGRQRAGVTAYDVWEAAFPAGTLSGVPKAAAIELIDALEPCRRGIYGGTVGYFDFAGDMDMAITIRTAVVREGVAHVQAGAGIILESVPEKEQAECEAKAAAMIRAIAAAATLRTLGN